MLSSILPEVLGALLSGFWPPRKVPEGACARCGRRPGFVAVPGTGPDQFVCMRCARTVARNHRLGVLFFAGIAALMAVITATAVIRGLVQDGRVDVGLDFVLAVVLGVGVPLGIAFVIHVATRAK